MFFSFYFPDCFLECMHTSCTDITTHTIYTACTCALFVCSVFSRNLQSVLVKETWICIRDTGKNPLYQTWLLQPSHKGDVRVQIWPVHSDNAWAMKILLHYLFYINFKTTPHFSCSAKKTLNKESRFYFAKTHHSPFFQMKKLLHRHSKILAILG